MSLASKPGAAWRIVAGGFLALFIAAPLVAAAVGLAIDVGQHGLPANDPTAVPTVAALAILIPLASFASWKLVAEGRGALAASRSRDPDPRTGWERFADAHPAFFARAWSLNGFGLRYLDFHDCRTSDATWSATLWLVAAFLPIAPLRCERVRVPAEERSGGVPFLLSWTRGPVVPVERLSMGASRTGRVYAFYYAVFLPLLVGPVFGGLALAIAHRHRAESTAVFWLGAFAALVWGIAVVAVERRWMGRPPSSRGGRDKTRTCR